MAMPHGTISATGTTGLVRIATTTKCMQLGRIYRRLDATDIARTLDLYHAAVGLRYQITVQVVIQRQLRFMIAVHAMGLVVVMVNLAAMAASTIPVT